MGNSPSKKEQCAGKIRHSCEKKAAVALKSLREKLEREEQPVPPMQTYYCIFCKGYHFGRLNAERAKYFKG